MTAIQQDTTDRIYSFQGKLIAAYWQSLTVRERSIKGVLATLRVRLPNVNAVAIKTNVGHNWMGDTYTPRIPSDLDIHSIVDVERWAEACNALKLDCIAWCVVKGLAPEQEAGLIAHVCNLPGIAAMILDVEAGPAYYKGTREGAGYIARTIRQQAPQRHIGLCFDARGQLPQQIYIEEWLPYMNSLHPMVYPEIFGRDPILAVKDAFGVLSKYKPYNDLPVTIWISAHSLKNDATLLNAAQTVFAQDWRAEGLVLWRYGDDVMREKEFHSIQQLRIPDHVAVPRLWSFHTRRAYLKSRVALRAIAYRTRLIRLLHALRDSL